MTPITRPCPHCQQPYDITRRLNGDQCWCPCGKWSTVVVSRLPGLVFLMPCDAPLGTEPARETAPDAALVAEMSALRAELEVARADAATLRGAAEAAVLAWTDYDKPTPMDAALRQLGDALGGNAGWAFLTRLAEAESVVDALKHGTHSTVEDALAAYDEVVKK